MKLIVAQRNQTPIYEQLYEQIVAQIVSGDIAENQCLPSIRFVARELEISVIPVKAAYEKLEEEGYIYTVPGKGCFAGNVAQNKKRSLVKDKMEECLNYCRQLKLSDEEALQLFADCCNEKQ